MKQMMEKLIDAAEKSGKLDFEKRMRNGHELTGVRLKDADKEKPVPVIWLDFIPEKSGETSEEVIDKIIAELEDVTYRRPMPDFNMLIKHLTEDPMKLLHIRLIHSDEHCEGCVFKTPFEGIFGTFDTFFTKDMSTIVPKTIIEGLLESMNLDDLVKTVIDRMGEDTEIHRLCALEAKPEAAYVTNSENFFGASHVLTEEVIKLMESFDEDPFVAFDNVDAAIILKRKPDVTEEDSVEAIQSAYDVIHGEDDDQMKVRELSRNVYRFDRENKKFILVG